MNSLNPVMRIKEQLADALQDHGVRLSKRNVAERVHDLLQWVGLRPEVADMFPHALERWHETTGLHCHRHQLAAPGNHRRRAHQRPGRGGAKAGDGDAGAASKRTCKPP